jgi:hypothetical protein
MILRRVNYVAISILTMIATSTVALGQGLRSQPVPGSVSKDGSLSLAVVLTNTGATAVKVFADEEPSASDNNGHKWIRGKITGIHVCEPIQAPSNCLSEGTGWGRWRDRTEQSATIIGPGDQVTIEIGFKAPETVSATFGDLYRLGLLVRVKDAGEWSTRSFGAANVPLRQSSK